MVKPIRKKDRKSYTFHKFNGNKPGRALLTIYVDFEGTCFPDVSAVDDEDRYAIEIERIDLNGATPLELMQAMEESFRTLDDVKETLLQAWVPNLFLTEAKAA